MCVFYLYVYLLTRNGRPPDSWCNISIKPLYNGVPGGSLVSLATIEVDVIGASVCPSAARDFFLQIDRLKVRELELAKFYAY